MSEKHTTESISRAYKQAVQNRKTVLHRNLFAYVCDIFTHAPLYSHWQNLLALFRRFRMFALILRVLTVVLTILQTGALVILSTAIFVVILPIMLILTIAILFTAFFNSRRSNRRMEELLADRRIYVLFLTERENPFLTCNAKDLAVTGAVIVVSPYWLSPKGLCRGKFYSTLRQEYPNVYLVRRYYFFNLRKHVLIHKEVAYLY